MRRLVLAATAALSVAQAAQAADWADAPVLRGGFSEARPRVVNWQGVYVGGQASYGTANMNFTNSTQNMLARLLNNIDVESEYKVSEWPLLGQTTSKGSAGYGGFIGYNTQWTDVIVGAEVSYLHSKFSGESSGSQGRTFMYPTDYYTTVRTAANASMTITDLASLRVRGGYAFGSFLPYVFGGAAMGRADTSRSVSAALRYTYVGTQVPPLPNLGGGPPAIATDDQKGEFIYGYSAGLGIDMMLYSNLFVRAEWEYLRFTSKADVNINTARLGLGYKF
jgi:opacity protein-like surface antigen